MHRGFIKLWRCIQDNDLWLSEPFDKCRAWIDLVMLARHQPGAIQKRGIKIQVDRGQVGWSERELADRWKWSRGKVTRFLKDLKNETQIEQQNGPQNINVTSLITIVNYDKYQSNEPQNEPQTEPQTGHKQTANRAMNKNEENEKNEKKESKPLVPKLQFSFDTGRWENLNGQVERWSTAYPAVNVQMELNKAGAWLMANPKNRKSNYESFMVKWLTRSQDSARPEKQQPKTFTAMKQEELINTLNKLNGDDNDQTDFFGRFSQTTRRIENQPDGDRIGGIHGRVIAINR